jgi:outer membrane lipoprotein-sorting protein
MAGICQLRAIKKEKTINPLIIFYKNLNMKRYIFLFYAMTLGSLVVQAQEKATDPSLSVDKMVNTYLENIGGVDNWKALTSIRTEAKMSQMGMEFPGVIIQAPPNKQRMEINIQGQQMIQAYDGKTAWWTNPFMGTTDAQPMPAEMSEEFTKEKFESEFINYKEKGHTLEYTGDVEVEGILCHELKMTKKDGIEEFHYFDPEYMIPIMQKTIVSDGQMQGQAVETYLSDYEEVDGLMMPKFMETKVGGATQFTLTIIKVELNVEFEDSMFVYPKTTKEDKD